MTTDVEQEFLTTTEVATVLRADREYVSRQCKAGNLPATKLGGRLGWRIRPKDLETFMGGGAKPSPRPPRSRKKAK